MQSRIPAQDGHARMRRALIRKNRADGGPRRNARFTIPSMALAGIFLLVLSCGDGAVEPAPPPPAPVATTVTISPASATLTALQETARLTAEVRDQNGQVMAGAAVAWASSDASVAGVDASGQVTAAANGSATITATAGSVSGTASVTVAQVVSAVAVSPAANTLVAFGDTVRLAAEAFDANGHGVAGSEFSWSSSDTLVARVDDSGLVESLAEGEVVVTATASDVTGGAELSVVPPFPTTVAVNSDTVAFTALGQTAQLAVEVRDQVGRVMDEASATWSSGDTLVVVVDSAGLVTAVGEGTATVTAAAGDVSDRVVVTVTQSAGSVAISPAEASIALGDTLRLAAEAFDENGHAVNNAVFSWSSGDAGVATVDDSGLVTGVAEGTAKVTAMAGDASGVSEITVENPDRAALVVLYEATDGPNWIDNTNWLTDAPLGEWYGVETDDSGRVVNLDLRGRINDGEATPHGLSGTMPPELGDLAKLEELDLAVNDLRGTIPPELGDLADLRFLDLRINELSGSVPPEFGRLASLRALDLEYNELSGSIPPDLGKLASLNYLWLSSNALSGPIPSELGELANLRALDLGYNELSGSIPPDLGKLASLYYLGLRRNDLSGSIPAELGDLASLERLWLSFNALSGPIPPELGSLASLRFLDLRTNELSGSVPSELGDLAGLTFLNLARNELSGALPRSLVSLTNLADFYFDGNKGLCAPGIVGFAEWLRSIEESEGPFCNESDRGVLESLFEAAGGSAWANADGWLGGPVLADWHGIRADSLGQVTALDLSRNDLAGQLPGNLGELGQMTELDIADNADLSGRLPLSLARGSLETLHYSGTDLCTPSDAHFRDWLNGIPSHEGTGVECAPLSDREILEIFYEATGGPQWTDSDGWMTDAPLRDWYGVWADREGRVVGLSLWDNGLSNAIPPEVGNLTNLMRLDLQVNALAGSIPPELGNLADLTMLGLASNTFDGMIPPELGDLGNLTILWLGGNDLTGPIPPEIGNLANLEDLSLSNNQFSGPIPPEIGNLANLKDLSLRRTGLTGSIPGELGRLARLERILLRGNALTGALPPQLGNLARARILSFGDNQLSGPIPPELGNLSSVTYLALDGNALSGPLPPELGGLTTLEKLVLDHNDLTSNVPSGFSGMSSLEELSLTNNPGMAGRLPTELTSLRRLEALLAHDTGLCVPTDPGFQSWLERVHKRRISSCVEGEPAAAYLTQAVQSREFPVPLVAGEKALLRVFPIARQTTSQGIPAVRARFYLNGRETHVESIPGKSAPIPTEVDESSLSTSANAEIPGHVVQPGLEMVIEVDPQGTLDPALGVATRIPVEGRLSVEVRAMPLFDLTLIPFVWSETGDSSIVDLVEAMAADPENHEMLADTRTLLPVGDLAVTAHEPVLSSSNSAFTIRDETKAIRAMEGATGHYMGMMSLPVTGAWGVAFLPGRSSFSIPQASTIAHELGHNMNLQHAPCRTTGDPSYPYPDGSIGAWGYDFDGGGRLVLPSRPDLMSYCDPSWIGDYGFSNALRYRLFDEGSPSAAAIAAPGRSLLLWGGIGADTVPYLEPAFVVEAPPTLPDSAGEYEVTGRTASGATLFSLSFAMPGVADGDGSSSFAFVLPVRAGWEADLAAITLSGPGGSVTLDGDSDVPMAILRNPRTGQVRGILRDPLTATAVAADGVGAPVPGIEVLLSRGIPSAAAWKR